MNEAIIQSQKSPKKGINCEYKIFIKWLRCCSKCDEESDYEFWNNAVTHFQDTSTYKNSSSKISKNILSQKRLNLLSKKLKIHKKTW